MRLVVEWVNATRPPDEKIRVEAVVCNSMLDFFEGGVEKAKRAYDNYQRSPRTCMSDWARAVYVGYRSTKPYVTPTEYARLAFKTKFVEREVQ